VSKLLIHKGTVLNRLRRIGKRGATATVILFTAVWINMALQPCLMAAEPLLPGEHQDGGCPHCPQIPDAHCGDETAGACAYIDGFDFDGRSAQLADLQADVLAVVSGPVSLPELRPIAWLGPPSACLRPGHTGPPLFVRNCAYLK
jgi:hypothetical protein